MNPVVRSSAPSVRWPAPSRSPAFPPRPQSQHSPAASGTPSEAIGATLRDVAEALLQRQHHEISLKGQAMSHDTSSIAQTILEIEKAINARWNNGDYTGFLEAYREDVTYFDPLTERCLIGRQAVKEHFQKYFTGAIVVRSEQFDPNVVVNDAGDTAILTYNLQNYVAGKDGQLQAIPLWNCTEVYRLFNGKWNIAHNHWSFARHPALIGNVSA